LGEEKGLERLLARLLGHETGVGVVSLFLVVSGDGQVVLGLAEPAQRRLTAGLHRRPFPRGGLG